MSNLKQNAKMLIQFILENYNEENDILMTETQLSQKFRISIKSVKEVMAVCKIIGAIEVRQGKNYRLVKKEELQRFYNWYLES